MTDNNELVFAPLGCWKRRANSAGAAGPLVWRSQVSTLNCA